MNSFGQQACNGPLSLFVSATDKASLTRQDPHEVILKNSQNFLGYGGFPAISTLISLQMFIQAPNPKFTPLGPSMKS